MCQTPRQCTKPPRLFKRHIKICLKVFPYIALHCFNTIVRAYPLPAGSQTDRQTDRGIPARAEQRYANLYVCTGVRLCVCLSVFLQVRFVCHCPQPWPDFVESAKKVAPVIQAEVHAPDPLSFITASTVLLSFFWIRFVNMTGSEI